jgi:HAD superfamily hydrolase (TIGR01509 family)
MSRLELGTGPAGRAAAHVWGRLSVVVTVEAVLLDLDGTLVDSVYVHAMAWREAFREVGLDVPTYQLHRAVGMGGDRLVAAVAGEGVEHGIGDVVRKLHDQLFQERLSEVRPLGGATEVLNACRDRGLRMVLASSSPPELTETLLSMVESSHLIGEMVCGDEAPSKPAPDLVERALERAHTSHAFLVGDAVWDVESADRAGIPCVGLLTGGYSEAELREAGAVAVFDTPRSLAAHLDEVLQIAT